MTAEGDVEFEVPRKRAKPRGACPVCGHVTALTESGCVRAHAERRMGVLADGCYGEYSSGHRCDGSSELPEVPDVR